MAGKSWIGGAAVDNDFWWIVKIDNGAAKIDKGLMNL